MNEFIDNLLCALNEIQNNLFYKSKSSYITERTAAMRAAVPSIAYPVV